MRHKIQAPGKRTNCPSFTPAQADAFLVSWYRVVAADGSTVAYTPDEPTAKVIAQALDADLYDRTSHI